MSAMGRAIAIVVVLVVLTLYAIYVWREGKPL
jgi:hypothetical protein